MALENIGRRAVLDAVAEFDKLGRTGFLRKYQFGRAFVYFLVIDDREYDAKAIVGVAHGYQFPEQGQLDWDTYSSGSGGVQRLLKSHGFTVRVKAVLRAGSDAIR